METKNNKKLFDDKTEKLIIHISTQYIEIFKIVKKSCPKDFSKEQVILMFLKTEAMFNNIQVQKYKKQRKKNGNGNGKNKLTLPKENKRTNEMYN